MLTYPPAIRDERLMTLEEAAVSAGVSVRTLARYRKSGALEVVKVGRRVFCNLNSIERALVSRSLQTLGREATSVEQEPLPLVGWLALLQEIAEANPSFEHPEHHKQYVAEASRLFPELKAGEYTVGQLRTVMKSLADRGGAFESGRSYDGYQDEIPVIVALRQLHARFSW
ncbi:MAG: helix-turn-helix domain-containing protein [Phycisphaerae bacterium]|nr:helix-turn-helix domain-containing protein [Phycisphaerae bacterium]